MERSGVKSPENTCFIYSAITLWILRCAQNDEQYL